MLAELENKVLFQRFGPLFVNTPWMGSEAMCSAIRRRRPLEVRRVSGRSSLRLPIPRYHVGDNPSVSGAMLPAHNDRRTVWASAWLESPTGRDLPTKLRPSVESATAMAVRKNPAPTFGPQSLGL